MVRPRFIRRLLRFRLITVFVVLTLLAVVLAFPVQSARQQEQAVEQVLARGGEVEYNGGPWAKTADGKRPAPPGPAWLRELLGRHHFDRVTNVYNLDFDRETLPLLRGLPDIEFVRVTQDVTDEDLRHLVHLRRLEFLDLDGAAITDEGVWHLRDLQSLEELGLGWTHISDKGLGIVADLTKLQHLGLQGTRITDAGIKRLHRLTLLKSVYLRETRISDDGIAALVNFAPGIEYLSLDDTAISDDGVLHLRRIRELRQLSLCNTNLTDKGMDTIAELRNLRNLYLDETGITDAGLMQLEAIARSHGLRVTCNNTRVTEEGAMALERVMGPGSWVEF